MKAISSRRDRGPGFRWPWHSRWGTRPDWVDVAWGVFSALNLAAIAFFSHWETIPFHFIWISFTLLYGFRVWPVRPTLWVLAVVIVTTAAVIGLDISRGTEPLQELTEVPLMAAMFWAMVWHARRRLSADRERQAVSDHNSRLLAAQRRFLQDASHQIRTPITIALGHAELLEAELPGPRQRQDIQIVLGELLRLRRIGERLLAIAASEDPDFLLPEPVALDGFVMEVLRRWRPSADRRWQLGPLEHVVADADRVQLGLAVDALLENAVRHTGTGDAIRLSARRTRDGGVRLAVSDTGSGIPGDQTGRIFDRFSSGLGAEDHGGTGLGLALVRAVARAHGGDVRVQSTPGEGSEFELVMPAHRGPAAGPGGEPGPAVSNTDVMPPGSRRQRVETSRD